LVGAYRDDDLGSTSGSAYIFERQSDGAWIQKAKLLANDGRGGDRFGWAVAIDGTKAIIGSPKR